jgi:hypothetical protein
MNITSYQPNEAETERASNSYLMSVIAVMAGMPLPIINLLASIIFFIANRKAGFYVKWHCTQVLLSQFTIFIINSIAFSWTVRIFFGNLTVNNNYLAYIITIAVFNIGEFIINVRAAIRTRKGIPVYWWFWGALTDLLVPYKQSSTNKYQA